MLTVGRGVMESGSRVSRRDFLRAGGLGAAGLALADLRADAASARADDRAVIFLMLVGGPSQLETWDPKPEAPSDVRGPFRAIETRVPGIRIGEHLPRSAQRMDRLTLIRSLHHDAAPIHETGHQLLQTGRLCRPGQEHPSLGSVVARIRGSRGDLPPFVVLPSRIGNTGVGVPHGQSAGTLGRAYDPFVVEADPASAAFDPRGLSERARRFLDESPESSTARALFARTAPRTTHTAFDLGAERDALRDAYGRNSFGQSCLLARRLVESGVRMVTVNMYETVFNRVSWDCHGSGPFSTFDDYAAEVLPTFDRAFSALIDDLERRGRLESTLVVATGEFGRTPRINPAGGRDHWPDVWSAVLAGGGTRGGQILGASDALGASPADRPVTPAELAATVYRSLGIDPSRSLEAEDGTVLSLVEGAGAVAEVFA